MQISGRLIILATFGVGLAMSAGAWWFHYQASWRAAKFWGPAAARLIVQSPELAFLELSEDEHGAPGSEILAGRAVIAQRDLSREKGLVHLRHALTQDANFLWDARRRESTAVDHDWAYALRFAKGDEQLVVLLRRDFKQIGKLTGDEVDILPSPRPAAAMRQYLSDIGALKAEAAAR